MFRCVCAALMGSILFVSSPAEAIMQPTCNAVGWTQDGSTFLYACGMDEPTEWTLVPARGGKSKVVSKEEYAAFAASHPLADALTESKDVKLAFDGQGRLDAEHAALEIDGKVAVRWQRGGAALKSETFDTKGSVSWSFSPDGKRVALFFVQTPDCKPSGTGDFVCTNDGVEARIDRIVGPRVQLLAKGLSSEALEKTAEALEKAGFAPTSRDEARAAREKSVVYAAKGLEADARRIAAAVPGGATVEALSWKTKFEVVVALGASAK
jgi:hypothetical protein